MARFLIIGTVALPGARPLPLGLAGADGVRAVQEQAMAVPSPWSFRIPRLFAVLPLLLAASTEPALAGTVRRVGPSRPFPTIQAAVDAASDGDVVLVDPGSYVGFSVDGKALSIVADSGSVDAGGLIDIDHLKSGQVLVLAGIHAAATSPTSYALQIRHSAGQVRVQSASFVGKDRVSYSLDPAGTAANIAFADDVVFTQCGIRGGDGASEQDASLSGGLGLFARSSALRLFASSFAGGHGSSDLSGDSWDGGYGGNGLETPAGSTFACECVFAGGYGGDGGDGDDPLDCVDGGNGGFGGNGILVGSSPPGPGSPLVQLLASTTQGGVAGGGGSSQCGSNGAPGQPGQPVRVNNGSSVLVTDAPRRMEGPSLLREYGLLPLTFRGSPGDQVRLDFQQGGFGPWSTHRGSNVIFPELRTLDLGAIPPSGVLVVQVPIDDLGQGVQSRTALMTPTFVDTNGVEHAGNSFAVVLLDSAF